MEKTVKLKYLRIAPRKVRLVADLVRGKSFESAQNLLNFAIKRGAPDLLRLLKSALAAFTGKEKENLYIKKIFIDEGPKYKRWMPRARGQAYEIQKKTSHVTIVLGELKAGKKRAEASAENKSIQAGPPKSSEAGFGGEKPKFAKPETEIKKPKVERSFKRFFRRKAI